MKLVKAVKPCPYGQKSMQAIRMLIALPVIEKWSEERQPSIQCDTWAEAHLLYRAAKRACVKIHVIKTNGHGWNVWRVA